MSGPLGLVVDTITYEDLEVDGASFTVFEYHGARLVDFRSICKALGLVWRQEQTRLPSDLAAAIRTIWHNEIVCLPATHIAAWLQTLEPQRFRSQTKRRRIAVYQQQCPALIAAWVPQ